LPPSSYGLFHHRTVTHPRRLAFHALPAAHQRLLASAGVDVPARLRDEERAVRAGAALARDLLRTGLAWAGLAAQREALERQRRGLGRRRREREARRRGDEEAGVVVAEAADDGELEERDVDEWEEREEAEDERREREEEARAWEDYVPAGEFGGEEAEAEGPEAEEGEAASPLCLPGLKAEPRPLDFNKAAQTLRQLFREWSAEGAAERAACFDPVLRCITEHYDGAGLPEEKRHTIKVLNPGCGLGRLVFELACAGFSVEGSEISYHMLIASMHMMNFVAGAGTYRLHPFALSGSNHHSHADRMRSVLVPDILPKEALDEASARSEVHGSDRIGIAAGDFCVVYKARQFRRAYDVLATVFFLDTAKNPLAYMETAANCVRPGGLWVNLGPLKWHFEKDHGDDENARADDGQGSDGGFSSGSAAEDKGIGNPGAVELCGDDVLRLLDRHGFEVLRHDDGRARDAGYIRDPLSMEATSYRPVFWVAQRREDEPE
jgi:carnosine N-methyltransferase